MNTTAMDAEFVNFVAILALVGPLDADIVLARVLVW